MCSPRTPKHAYGERMRIELARLDECRTRSCVWTSVASGSLSLCMCVGVCVPAYGVLVPLACVCAEPSVVGPERPLLPPRVLCRVGLCLPPA